MAKERTDIQYRGYQIIANDTGAMVYSNGLKHSIDGLSMDDCLSNAKAFVDSRHKQRKISRREKHIGTVDDYSAALDLLNLGQHETRMLSAHRKASGRKMTATELSNSAGWDGAGPANSHYGRLGKRVSEHLNLEINAKDDEAWTQALAEFDHETRQWEMHEELAFAIDRLNIS